MIFVPISLEYRSPKNHFTTRKFLNEDVYTSVPIHLSETEVTVFCPGQVYFLRKYDSVE
jgi:hypothetical protein